MASLVEEHFQYFKKCAFEKQGPLGLPPLLWAEKLGLNGVPLKGQLPNISVDRNSVRPICRDFNYPVIFGYVCTMCWGIQEKGPRGDRGVLVAWEGRETIEKHLEKNKNSNLSRCETFNFFKKKVKGLGPSYFTKLLFFFSPAEDMWIMDQWTAKSVNLLTGERVVRLSGGLSSNMNKGGNYQAFCEEIDNLASQMNCSGNQIEQRLMSRGKPPGKWRQYVVKHDYDKEKMVERYPHINSAEL
jgi:hypothetical protein